MNYIVWKLDGSTLTKVTDNYPVKGTNNAYNECLYAPWGTDAVKVNFLPQRFYDLNGVNPITGMKAYQETDQEVIDAIVPEASQEANYGLWYFPMLEGLTSILTSYNQSQYKIAFERVALEDDPQYLGEYATSETTSVLIDSVLKVAYPLADDDEFVNVYLTTTNVYSSYKYDATGDEWTDYGSVINQSIIDRTNTATETFKGTVFGNEDYTTEYDPSELANVLNVVYTEIAELNSIYTSITNTLPNYMLIEDYDSESGIASSAVKYSTNLKGTTTDITSQSVIEHIINVSNPHTVTKAQVGLSEVDNTADVDKPISTATQAELDLKASIISTDYNFKLDRERLTENELDIDNLELANMFKSASFESTTGVITFTLYDGSTTSINLPTELIVSGGSYDPVTKDLTLILASGAEIVIPLDDILTGVATESYVQTQLESYYTKTAANSTFLKVGTTKTSDLINDGDGDSVFITADDLGNAGYGDMTELEYAKNGAVGVVDKAVVAESLETNAVNYVPYIGDDVFTNPKNGIAISIKNDNLVQPDVEGLTFSQLVDGGDFVSATEFIGVASDLTIVDNKLNITGNGTSSLMIAYQNIGVSKSIGDELIVTFDGNIPTDTTLLKIQIFETNGTIESFLLTPTLGSLVPYSKVITLANNYTDFGIGVRLEFSSSTIQNGKVGVIDNFNVIPVPTKLASYTDAQILRFFNGADYIPYGLHGIKDLVITSNYTNLFDKNSEMSQGGINSNGTNETTTTKVRMETYIPVIGSNSYTYKSHNQVNGENLIINRLSYYDSDYNFISQSLPNFINPDTITTISTASYVRLTFQTPTSAILTVEDIQDANIQFNIGTTALDYVEYQAPLTYELDTAMYSNDTRDLQGDGVDTTVVKSATSWTRYNAVNDTIQYGKDLSSELGYGNADNAVVYDMHLKIGDTIFTSVKANDGFNTDGLVVDITTSNLLRIRVSDTTYPTSADFEAYLQANDVTFIYELETYLPRTEANDNLLVERGQLLVSEYGSYTQDSEYGVKTEFWLESAIDLVKQVQLGVETDVVQEKKLIEIDDKICGTHEAIQILELTAAKINPLTSKPDYDYASQSFLFPQNNTTERLYATLPSPDNWVIGTPIRLQAHITQEVDAQAVMKCDYKLFEAIGATIPAVATTYTMDTYVNDSYVSGSMSNAIRDGVDIDTSAITTRAFIRLEIYRDDNVYTGDLKVDDVAIFYTAYNCCDCSTVE